MTLEILSCGNTERHNSFWFFNQRIMIKVWRGVASIVSLRACVGGVIVLCLFVCLFFVLLFVSFLFFCLFCLRRFFLFCIFV